MIVTLLALLLQAQDPPPAPEPLFKTLAKQVTVGAQLRVRVEYRDPTAYDTAASLDEDDDTHLLRIRCNLKAAVTDDIDVFVQPQDQRTFGQEASVASDERNLDLHQGWAEMRAIGGTPLTVKVGRMELSYGDQRVVSPLDWSNVGRAWDGVNVRWHEEGFRVDAFFTVIREGGGAEDDQDFFGIYSSCTAVTGHEFDAYVLARRFANNAFTDELGNVGDLKSTTIGARLKGKSGPVDYSAEGDLQTGTLVDTDVRALAFAITAGVTAEAAWKPRVGIEVTWASGDGDGADGDEETFDPPFPFAHAYQGTMDLVGWRNSLDLCLNVRIAPAEGVTVHLDLHHFRLVEDRDSWYGAAGAPVRTDATGQSDADLGSELDLHARIACGKFVKVWAGVSHFAPGGFVGDTGRDPSMTWGFAQVTVEF